MVRGGQDRAVQRADPARSQGIARRPVNASQTPAGAVLVLQRAAGNGAVVELLRSASPQATDDDGADFGGGLRSPRFQALAAFGEVLRGTRLLKWASPGSAPVVAAVQGALAAAGFEPGPVDGRWGPLTNAAVAGFQRQQGLIADAIIGPATLPPLDAADAGAGTPVPAETSSAGADAVTSIVTGQADTEELSVLAQLLGVPGEVVFAAGPDIFAAAGGPTGVAGALPVFGSIAHGDADVRHFGSSTDTKQANDSAGGASSGAAPSAPRVTGEQIRAALPILDAIAQAVDTLEATGQLQLPPQEVTFVRQRIAAAKLAWSAQAGAADVAPVDSRLLSVVSLAASQIGATDSTKAGPKDPDDKRGRHFRVSRERIFDFFDTAYDGKTSKEDAATGHAYDPDLVNHITAGKVFIGHDENGEKKFQHKSDTLPDWCGIFVLWAFKKAGFALPGWQNGSTLASNTGLYQVAGAKPDPALIRPGDIGHVSSKQHQFLIVEVRGDELITIEGNTDSSLGAQGGQVAQHTKRAASKIDVGIFRPLELKEPQLP